MAFEHNLRLTIPANTPSSDERRVFRSYINGIRIDSLELHVPLGHEGLQPVWVELDGTKVFPSDGTEYVLDDVTRDILKKATIHLTRTTEIALVGYNDDDQFPHTTTLIVQGRWPSEVKGGR